MTPRMEETKFKSHWHPTFKLTLLTVAKAWDAVESACQFHLNEPPPDPGGIQNSTPKSSRNSLKEVPFLKSD